MKRPEVDQWLRGRRWRLKLVDRFRLASQWDEKINVVFDEDVSVREVARRVADAGLADGRSDTTVQRIISAARKFNADDETAKLVVMDLLLSEIRGILTDLRNWIPRAESVAQALKVNQHLLRAYEVAVGEDPDVKSEDDNPLI